MTTVILLPRTDLVNCFNEAFVKGEMSILQRRLE